MGKGTHSEKRKKYSWLLLAIVSLLFLLSALIFPCTLVLKNSLLRVILVPFFLAVTAFSLARLLFFLQRGLSSYLKLLFLLLLLSFVFELLLLRHCFPAFSFLRVCLDFVVCVGAVALSGYPAGFEI